MAERLFTISKQVPAPRTPWDDSLLRALATQRDEIEKELRTIRRTASTSEVTTIDGETVTILNPAAFRTKLGLDAIFSNLNAQIANLLEQVSSLSARLTALGAELRDVDDALLDRIAALETEVDQLSAGETTIPSFDVKTAGGVDLYDFSEVPIRDWQNMVIESPETGKLYRVQAIRDAGGQTNFELVEADTLTASDGRRWRLRVEFTDGIPNLAYPEALS